MQGDLSHMVVLGGGNFFLISEVPLDMLIWEQKQNRKLSQRLEKLKIRLKGYARRHKKAQNSIVLNR